MSALHFAENWARPG